MRFIRKAAALLLTACFLFQGVSVSAAVKKAKAEEIIITTLTVEEAAKIAIRNNTSVKNAEEDETFFEQRHKEAVDNFKDSTTDQELIANMAKLMSLELDQALSLKDLKAQKENIEYQVLQQFNTILSLEQDVEIFDENLVLAERKLVIDKLKLDLGMLSKFEYDNAVLDIEKTKTSRDTKLSAINAAYINLNRYMGVNLEQRYILELELEFEPLKETNIERYSNDFVEQSLNVKRAENAVKTAQYSLDNFITPHNPLTNEITENSTNSYESYVYRLNQAARALDDTKINVKQTVIKAYSDLKDMEISIKAAEIEIEKLYSQLTVLEKQFELGQTTQLTVDNLKYNIRTAEINLEKIKNNHAIAFIAFSNPNILS